MVHQDINVLSYNVRTVNVYTHAYAQAKRSAQQVLAQIDRREHASTCASSFPRYELPRPTKLPGPHQNRASPCCCMPLPVQGLHRHCTDPVHRPAHISPGPHLLLWHPLLHLPPPVRGSDPVLHHGHSRVSDCWKGAHTHKHTRAMLVDLSWWRSAASADPCFVQTASYLACVGFSQRYPKNVVPVILRHVLVLEAWHEVWAGNPDVTLAMLLQHPVELWVSQRHTGCGASRWCPGSCGQAVRKPCCLSLNCEKSKVVLHRPCIHAALRVCVSGCTTVTKPGFP